MALRLVEFRAPLLEKKLPDLKRSNGEIALSAMFRYQSGDDNPRQRAEQSQFGQQQYRCKDHIWVTTHPIARFPLWPAVINVHDPEHIFRAEDHRSDHQYAGQQIPADKRMRDDKRDEHCASFRGWLEGDNRIRTAFQHCR